MGYSISWIAVKGQTPETLNRSFGIKETSKKGVYGEHPLVGGYLANGWYILIANEGDAPLIAKKCISRLSMTDEAVACVIEEHIMFSSCAHWKAGKRIWSVEHRGEHDIFDLSAIGDLPQDFDVIKSSFIDKQISESGDNAEVDHLFDLPLELAKRMTGFKHDEESADLSNAQFNILDITSGSPLRKRFVQMRGWMLLLAFIAIMFLFGLLAAAAGDLIKWLYRYFVK